MRVEMITLYADAERSVQPGQQAVFPPEKAQALIAGGYARAVEEGEVRTRPVTKTRGRGKQPAKDEQPSADGEGGEGDGGGGGATDPPQK